MIHLSPTKTPFLILQLFAPKVLTKTAQSIVPFIIMTQPCPDPKLWNHSQSGALPARLENKYNQKFFLLARDHHNIAHIHT